MLLSWTAQDCEVTMVSSALMICSCTLSSVVGPVKQLQMELTMVSISSCPSSYRLSYLLPVKWP